MRRERIGFSEWSFSAFRLLCSRLGGDLEALGSTTTGLLRTLGHSAGAGGFGPGIEDGPAATITNVGCIQWQALRPRGPQDNGNGEEEGEEVTHDT
jgi:hypothetical protein